MATNPILARRVGIILFGLFATIRGDLLPYVGGPTKELGPGIFTAGILALLVEPFFRKEFARDAFLAAFRYVLPSEFREEVEKILKFDFIAESQLWSVQIDKIDDETVLVTTTYERVIKNKTKINKRANAWYVVPDFGFRNGSTKVIECGIEQGTLLIDSFVQTFRKHDVEAKTDELVIRPDDVSRVWGKATQFRRTNDAVYETFRVPIKNPEIEVIIDENEFHMT